mmetsp:Transcript_11103/g.24744  ORF Transcript_11103/g.24744 Transcript_11103/m.24744 type:complete len:632 (+) Transcript_11103:156-2051(+)
MTMMGPVDTAFTEPSQPREDQRGHRDSIASVLSDYTTSAEDEFTFKRPRQGKNRQGSIASVWSTIVALDAAPIADQVWFSQLTLAISVINTLLLGVELHVVGLDAPWKDRGLWLGVDIIMSLAFIVETFVRFKGYGPWMWLFGAAYPDTEPAGGLFNVVDAITSMTRLLFILSFLEKSQTAKLFSTLRVIHIGKLAQVRQNEQRYRELWAFFVGMSNVLPYLGWITLVACGLLYWVGIVMTILVDADANHYDYKGPWTQHDYWGSVPQSTFTMFQVLLLDHWYSTIARPLVLQHHGFAVIFFIVILIGSIGLMNSVTSFIVEGTLASAVDAEESRNKEKQYLDKLVMQSFRSYVEQADEDKSGEIDPKELDFLTKTYIVRDRLRLLGIAPDDLQLLTTLLDENGSGRVEIGKFFRGVLRLRGDATASDLYKLHLDVSRGIKRITTLVNKIDTTNEILVKLIDATSCMNVDIVKGEPDVHDEFLSWIRQQKELDPEHNDATERERQLMVRFGVEEEQVGEMLQLADRPQRSVTAHSKKLMHASLRDGVTHVPDEKHDAIITETQKDSTVFSRSSTRRASTRAKSQKSFHKQDTSRTLATKGSFAEMSASGKPAPHGVAMRTKTGLAVFKTYQ